MEIVGTDVDRASLLAAAQGVYPEAAFAETPDEFRDRYFTPGYPAREWRLWRASDLRRIDGIEEPVNWDVVAP